MRRMNFLLACVVAVMTCATGFAARTSQEVPRPDLIVRHLEMKKNVVTVFILNKGKADAPHSHVTLSGTDSSGEKWSRSYDFDKIAPGATVQIAFVIQPHAAEPGTFLRAEIAYGGRVQTTNARELRVPEAEVPVAATPKPTPKPPPPPPAPKEKPLLSPDMAAADIYFTDTNVVGVLKNVGDRDFHAKDANIKDSFKRVVTFKRVVHVGATSYTEDLKTRTMGNARVGETFKIGFPHPKHVPGATKYTWILTIEGNDPDMQNNTFKKVEKFTKID